jgi:hypothetical protein
MGRLLRTSALKGFRLIDEHDGDSIPDLVEKLAGVANQTILSFVELDEAFALGAGQYVQKVLADAH